MGDSGEAETERIVRVFRNRWARLLVSLASLGGLFVVLRAVSVRQIASTLSAAHGGPLLLTLPVLAMNFWFRSARFAELLGNPPRPHPAVPMRGFVASVVLNHAANNVLPLRAGDLIRTRDFVARGYSLMSVAVTQVVEKAVEGTTLLACASPILWTFLAYRKNALLILALLALGAPVSLFLVRNLRKAFTQWRGDASRIGRRELLHSFVWSLAADLMDVGLIFLCAKSLGIDGGLSMCLTVYGAVNLAIAIPSTPGHFGALEAGASLSLIALGVPRPSAVAFALLYRAVQWVPVTTAGGIVLLLRGRKPLVRSRQ